MNPNGMFNNPNQPAPQNGPKKKGPLPPRWGWINTVSAGLVILFLIVSIYSAVSQNSVAGTPESLTDLADSIASSSVASIVVKGDTVDATYKDGTEKTTQTEDNGSLTATLGAYGITPKQLSAVSITVEEPSGALFWLENLAPTLLSILFVILFLWLMTRQMRGAGMQAFSFGQSKARITMPDDTKQKVTFKDVAGAKEAKEELAEIVDFLKNPKKFLEIGARSRKACFSWVRRARARRCSRARSRVRRACLLLDLRLGIRRDVRRRRRLARARPLSNWQSSRRAGDHLRR